MHALDRSLGSPTCDQIMSRDVVTIDVDASRDKAIEKLLTHNIRTLPVVDDGGYLKGTVGLRELASKEAGSVRTFMSEATKVSPNQSALELLPTLTDDRHHVVVVVTPDDKVLGVVSQTDMLATLYRSRKL